MHGVCVCGDGGLSTAMHLLDVWQLDKADEKEVM